MRKLATFTAAAALVAAFGFAGTVYAAPSISKALTVTTGPNNTDPIPQGAGATTTYEFTITYTADGGPAVTIIDTIPSEFDSVVVVGGACNSLSFGQVGHGGTKGATRIKCTLSEDTDASLLVTFQTRNNPGHGKKDPPVLFFEPTECTFDDLLLLNDGAVAVDAEDNVVAGPTDPLTVTIDGCV